MTLGVECLGVPYLLFYMFEIFTFKYLVTELDNLNVQL